MSTSSTDLVSCIVHVALPFSSAKTNTHHVATLVKAFKDGTEMDAPNEAILKVVMENAQLRDALMLKSVMDNMKLHGFLLTSQYMVEDFPKAVEIASDFKASAAEPIAIVKRLTPPFGTKGFSKLVLMAGFAWESVQIRLPFV
ncbi:hypothetical protein BDP27DRAFT_1369282 [Rhodocollybia butyracea]|uniref:Uncharacterized protein n=1 Tax=Rhodocollybia butyracea TaxID=206335 RepID=A0A9P5PFQ7_9AGAR|nr:hypothetical protein BDP27DRAFT_1369282 [Rhodocollybia butyracea]